MKKLFSAYFRIKPFLYAFAILCVVPIAANQFINYRSKLVNTDPWIVGDVVSGDRFIVQRNDQTLEVKLCGISASEESKDYLRSLLDKGNGSVVLERVSNQNELTVAEVFMQIKPDYQQEIHLNTEMVMGGKATLSNYKICPNAEYFELAAEMEK